jgi:hypothetical protein
LIQPGKIQGALRIHIQGWAQGVVILEESLTIPSITGGERTFDLILHAALPGDVDGGMKDIDALSSRVVQVVEGRDVQSYVDEVAKTDTGGWPDRPSDNQNHDIETKPERREDVALDAHRDVGVEAQTSDTLPTCEMLGLCQKPQGSNCELSSECASGNCADGVCCNNACLGPCRSCDQPSEAGTCQGYPSDTDPMLECPSGSFCNGLGACGPITPPTIENGQPCIAAKQCLSGFCADGVCCNTACTGVCKTCATGKCTAVKKTDDPPRCTDTKTCDNQGTCVDKK